MLMSLNGEPNMKQLSSPGVPCLLVLVATLWGTVLIGQERDAGPGARELFVGAWRLVSLEEEGADGQLRAADCSGMLVFTREGRMSVQVMYASQEPGAAAAPVQYAQGGYEASFGRYQVDPFTRTFVYHVEGGLVRSLVGKDLARVFELAGNRLTVKSASPSEHWKVVWEHY
jgi:hypothetical protein